MDIVTENTIEEIIDYFETFPDKQVAKTSTIMEEYPALLAYLEQESNAVLLEEEKDLQWYIIVVCISSMLDQEIHVPAFTEELLTSAEEQNWEVLEATKSKDWREKLTPFFTDYKQEDLLAFVEDILQEDEDTELTPIGREVIFITAKSVIDAVFGFVRA